MTLPEWAESDIRQIASSFNIEELDKDGIKSLRLQLDAAGLGEYYPDALHQISSRI